MIKRNYHPKKGKLKIQSIIFIRENRNSTIQNHPFIERIYFVVDYSALALACKNIVKDTNALGIFSTAAISSVVGNRNIEFKALMDDDTIIDLVKDKGYLLTSGDKGTRQNFDAFYSDAFSKPLTSEKLLAYWLTWSVDVSGASASLVGLLANEFIKAGVRLPVTVVKYTTVNSTKNGVKKSRVVKQVFSRETLLKEITAIVGDPNNPDNPGIITGMKAWVGNSPTRSGKYTSTGAGENEDVVLNPVTVVKADENSKKEFEL